MPPHLSDIDRARIISKLEDGYSMQVIAQQFNVSKTAVFRINKKWNEEGTIKRKVGSGRPRCSTAQQDLAIVNHIRENPFHTAIQAKEATNFPGCSTVVIKRLKDNNIRNHMAANKIHLTERHKEMRMVFSQQFLRHPANFWDTVIFSDEKIFKSYHDGRVKVYRPRNTRFDERYINPIQRQGHFSLHVWGWMSSRGQGVLWRVDERFTAERYRTILENIMLPSVTHLFPDGNFIFQHDNSPVHRARIINTWLEENHITTLPWPAKSPDLNPIENLWGIMVKNIYQEGFRPTNANELWDTVEKIWDELQFQYLDNLIRSVPRRLAQVVAINGAMTRY